ncbi:MAG: beta-glucosidase [Thermoprotei archaeon]|nr:MAG: beta-glucosidase [Thermoprotei archaeon]
MGYSARGERGYYIPPDVTRSEIYRRGWIDFNKNGVKDPYEDPSRSLEERVEDLLSRMTLEEKVAQLQSGFEISKHGIGNLTCVLRSLPPREGAVKANELQARLIEETRLGIPAIIHDECLHGCVAMYSTSFPQAIALAATWDPDLVYRVARAVARETRVRGIRQCLSPVVNIVRDVRAGRTEESYGEDPYLTSVMGEAYCKALREEGVIATPKHFVANFVGDGGRDSHAIHFSERVLREVYLPGFEACIKAGALSIMAAYNSLDGTPCSCNRWLLTRVLREEWGFEGFVVSDYGSVSHIVSKHHVAASFEEAARLALEAGLDVELPRAEVYGEPLLRAVREGLIPEEVLDEAVRRVLRVKFLIGLFDNPFVDPEEAEKVVGCEEHRLLALQAAREAIVLLKNDGGLLPIDREGLKSIAVIGPYSDELPLGGYSGVPPRRVTPLEAIRSRVKPGTEVYHAKGCSVALERPSEYPEEFWEAVEAARKADIAIVFVGIVEGEGRDRARLELPGLQEDLIEKVVETGTPTVVVLMTGSAVTGDWIEKVPAIVQAWYPGQEGGTAIAEVLFGEYNPGGKLPFTWPRHVGQLPLYYNMKPSGRGYDYVDMPGKPLFPFGHGLSYTEFKYSDLRISVDEESYKVTITVTVENVGDREGDEVVQLYLHDPVASVVRPLKELRGFKRIRLKPGERETVTFTLTPDDLALIDADMRRVVEPGEFEVMVGSSSEDLRLKGSFHVRRRLTAEFEIVEVRRRDEQGLVAVEVIIKNSGVVTDTANVKLLVDGGEAASKTVKLAPGEARKVEFKLEKGKWEEARVVLDV